MNGHQSTSYIHCDNDNYYRPRERLQNLFGKRVVQPFENHPSTPAWESYVRHTDHTYHRKTILDRGRTNFDEPFNDLTPEDKVLLYCVYYMPMHLFSSYHVFTKHLALVSHKVVFIDFGCGPLTSGIAFWEAFAGHCDITYLGIDSSQAMHDKAREISSKWRVLPNWNRLSEVLDQYIMRGDQTHIIFNFSYFLASKTLNIEDLCNCLTQIMAKYSQHKMCLVYQNPVRSPDSHCNWRTIEEKHRMTFRSRITQNVEAFSCDRLILQNGRVIWRNWPFDVYFDILSNRPADYSNNPYRRGIPWNN